MPRTAAPVTLVGNFQSFRLSLLDRPGIGSPAVTVRRQWSKQQTGMDSDFATVHPFRKRMKCTMEPLVQWLRQDPGISGRQIPSSNREETKVLIYVGDLNIRAA